MFLLHGVLTTASMEEVALSVQQSCPGVLNLAQTPRWRRREAVEAQEWDTGHQFSDRIIVDSRAGALQTASEWRRRDTVRTDGSRIETGGGSGMCLAATQWLDRTPLSHRDKQGGIRRGDVPRLPGAPGLGPAPGEWPSLHGLRRLHCRHRPGEYQRTGPRPALHHRGDGGLWLGPRLRQRGGHPLGPRSQPGGGQ